MPSFENKLEQSALGAKLRTRKTQGGSCWQVVNRIAIEELEAWYFGNWTGVRGAYPKVHETVINQARYRHCDKIAGGTWEAFERVLKRFGYFEGGLRKAEAAARISKYFDCDDCTSPSFISLRDALNEAL